VNLQGKSVRLVLSAILIGTASAWATSPHDKAVGPYSAAVAHARTPSQLPPPGIWESEGGQPQGQSAAGQDEVSEAARNGHSYPFLITVLPPEEAKRKAEEEAAERQNKASSDWWLVALTGLLGLATIALVAATLGLVAFARQQARDMKESVSASKSAATAALRSADFAEMAVVHAQRAFVFPVDLQSHPTTGPINDDYEHIITVIWKNTGATPVVNCRLFTSWSMPETSLPTGFDFPDLAEAIAHRTTIGPGEMRGGYRIRITNKHFREFAEDRRLFYVWGWCEYNDVFVDTQRHRTEFCFRVEKLQIIGEREASGQNLTLGALV